MPKEERCDKVILGLVLGTTDSADSCHDSSSGKNTSEKSVAGVGLQ